MMGSRLVIRILLFLAAAAANCFHKEANCKKVFGEFCDLWSVCFRRFRSATPNNATLEATVMTARLAWKERAAANICQRRRTAHDLFESS